MFARRGLIPLKTVVGKFVTSSLTLASGIALGREGPSVQIGAGLIEAGDNSVSLYAYTGTAGEASKLSLTGHAFGMSVIVAAKHPVLPEVIIGVAVG